MAEGQNTLAVATLRSILNKAHTTLDQQLEERVSITEIWHNIK